MSGIEVAGIVLAVLPIAAKVTKTGVKGINQGRKLLDVDAYIESKRDWFDALFRELTLVHRHLREVLRALPNISEARRSDLLLRPGWQPEPDVIQAMKTYLEEDFESFDHAILEIYRLLQDVFHVEVIQSTSIYPQNNIQTTSLDLKRYNQNLKVSISDSNFRERFGFLREERKLREQTKRLKGWRKFLDRITQSTQHQRYVNVVAPSALPTVGTKCSRPSYILPSISRCLHKTLTQHWKCSQCHNFPGTQQAKVCLQLNRNLHRAGDPKSVDYQLLLSIPHGGSNGGRWQESRATVHCVSVMQDGALMHRTEPPMDAMSQSICSVVSQPRQRGVKLCFAIDHVRGVLNESLYRTHNQRSTFNFMWSRPVMNLDEVLLKFGHNLEFTQRRELALALTYGFLTLSDSPWLKPRWTKQHVSFFTSQKDIVSLDQPFVSSQMNDIIATEETRPLHVIHPLPGVLSLGILLLELETGRSIESMRINDDYLDPVSRVIDENTDFVAANREAEAIPMSTPLYKEAVLACLSEQIWSVGYGHVASLNEESVRKRLYEQVVDKLEADLDTPDVEL